MHTVPVHRPAGGSPAISKNKLLIDQARGAFCAALVCPVRLSSAAAIKWGHCLPCDYGALVTIRRRTKRASITASDRCTRLYMLLITKYHV